MRSLLISLLLTPAVLGCGQRLYVASPQINKMTAPEICVVVVPEGAKAEEVVKSVLEACQEAAKHRL